MFKYFPQLSCISLSPQEYLPPEYTYCVCQFDGDSSAVRSVSLRVALTTQSEADEWFTQLQTRSFVTWRVANKVTPKEGGRNIFRVSIPYQIWNHSLPFTLDMINRWSNRALFRKPLQCFIRNSKAIVNDSHLVSAMHTYGRYNGAALATRRLGCKARLQTSTQIGVQPLAVARRKVPLGGRRRLKAGRPSKSSFTAGHNLVAKKRRQVAPHSLGQCVEANIALGKTHSAT